MGQCHRKATFAGAYRRRQHRRHRQGLTDVRVSIGELSPTCDCGAPTVAVGHFHSLRTTGASFANFMALCADCAHLVDPGVRVEWLGMGDGDYHDAETQSRRGTQRKSEAYVR